MKSFIKQFFNKMKGFRLTIISIILLLLATYRLFRSGNGIIISGVCASIVPFICQFRNYPVRDSHSSELINTLSDYILNIFYMIVYLGYSLLITFLGKYINPCYITYSYFNGTILLAICLNMIFISVIYTIGYNLTEKQRLMIGIILCNGQLGIMMLADTIIQSKPMINIYCIGFIVLIFILTLSFIFFTYYKKKQ